MGLERLASFGRFLTSGPFLWLALAFAVFAAWLFVPEVEGADGEPVELIPGLSLAESVAFLVGGVGYGLLLLASAALWASTFFLPRELLYDSLDIDWFYQANGDLSGTLVYTVRNNGHGAIAKLPKESIVWYKRPDERDVRFRLVFRDGGRPHTLPSERYEITDLDRLTIGLKHPQEHVIEWEPDIYPLVEPGETVTYEAQLSTPGTETAAFTPAGTTVGHPVHYWTGRLSLEAHAPLGWRIELMNPPFLVADIDTGKARRELTRSTQAPLLVGDGSKLTWALKRPRKGARYIANYRFVKK
jgi:hypothetical protein